MQRTGFWTLLIVSLCTILIAAAQEIATYQSEAKEEIGLVVSKREFTEHNKKQLLLALQGTASLFRFLHEANFFQALTSVSAVAGPVFMVASVLINIIFLFIKIESPEMKQLKIEFARLNNRLDQWSGEFNEIKRKINWNAIQVSYADYELNIQTMSQHLNSLVNAPETIRSIQRQRFINQYESIFLESAEKLFKSMVNTEMMFSENLFKASQTYSEFHRGKVQAFMMGNLQLLIKAVQIQGAYIELRYNSTSATAFAQDLWTKKFAVLQQKMEEVDRDTRNKWSVQSESDLVSLLATHHSLSNEKFEEVVYQFMTSKYNWRVWHIVTYKDIRGWDNHAAWHCTGSDTGVVRFSTNGRNVHMASMEPYSGDNAEGRKQRANQLLDYYEKNGVPRGRRSDYAKIIYETFANANSGGCDPFRYVGVIAWGSNVWFYHGNHLAYRKICIQGKSCFNVYLFV